MNAPVFVSLIIPCRNEEGFIGQCLDSIIANDYPRDLLEVLVVDGVSEDGTRGIVEGYAGKYAFIHPLDNPKRTTPSALNIGIAHAKGEVIMRMDAHSTLNREYISRCVKVLHEDEADNVGGLWEIFPRRNTLVGKAIARSLSHLFGVGNAHYRIGDVKGPTQVDTVPFFCCKKDLFHKVGLFNEDLERGQDMEFNLRLKKAGSRTLLVPDIVSYYYARSDMKSFWKHNWRNGVWAILPFLYSDIVPVSWRHLVPLAFVLTLLGATVLSLVWPDALWVLYGVTGAHVFINLAISARIAVREGDVRYLVAMPVVFVCLHMGYGLGSLWGLLRVLAHGEATQPC